MSLREKNKARIRARILDAARQSISQVGVAATTTRAIASAAEISYQTLYNYYPNKALIIRDLLDEEFATWSRDVDQVIKRYDGDLVGTLVHINEVAVQMVVADPSQLDLWREVTRAMFDAQVGGEPLASLSAAAHEQIHALLSLAQGMGHLRQDLDLHLMGHTLFCLSDYSMVQLILGMLDTQAYLDTQRQQIQLLIGPHLLP